MDGDAVWAAAGSSVTKFLRGKPVCLALVFLSERLCSCLITCLLVQVARIENPLETAIATIVVFGSKLLGLTEDGTHLLVWDTATTGKSISASVNLVKHDICFSFIELVNSIEFDADFTATHVLHPATYLNKVLIGSSQGGLQLWNIVTG